MKTYIFSDSHFGSLWGGVEENEKVRRFLELTEKIGKVDRFILLGDIFDFWFEYRYVIPRVYFPILSRIAEMAKDREVYYVCGNHDLWVGDFFEDLGVKIVRDELRINFDDFKALFIHGDRIQKTDLGGQLTRFIMGNRVSRFLFSLVHPDLGFAMARFVSRMSRGRSMNKKIKEPVPSAVERILEKGVDLVVMGHIHLPFVKRVKDGLFVSLGDWMWHFTYGEIEGKVFRLMRYPDEILESVTI